ncbi:MAG: V-type proton ATPase subunit E [Chlamydiia bacterium]|nr:V-type proton ATPase subunit E [Chlamydiia bacterium]
MKLFSLLHKRSVHTGEKKIIPASEFSTLCSAKEIVDEAKIDSDKLIAAAHEEAKKIKQEAYEKGFQEGLNRLSDHIALLESKLRQMQHDMQAAVLPLVLKSTKKVVGEQIRLHSETIVDIVLHAIRSVSQCRSIKIIVSKQDIEAIEAHRDEIRNVLEHMETLTIEEGKDLEPGDCVIETEKGILNARLEHLFTSLETAFNTHMRQGE